MDSHEKLLSSDEDSDCENTGYIQRRRKHPKTRFLSHIVGLIALVVTNIASFIWGSYWPRTELEHMKAINVWSPLHSSVSYHLHADMLNATTQTDNPSLWRADPSPEGDQLWKDNWDTYPILIPFDDLAKLGQDPEYGVRWPYKGTSMTAVGSHAHHLLHCLDVLRKTVWADHYWPNGNLNPGHRTHQTHCIDILRQDLMCRAPMDVYSFIWLESEPASQPNFNISMKCGDWDGMLARWKERQLSKEEAHMDPEKPEGVKEWPAPNALKQENAALLELCNKPGVNCTIDGEPI